MRERMKTTSKSRIMHRESQSMWQVVNHGAFNQRFVTDNNKWCVCVGFRADLWELKTFQYPHGLVFRVAVVFFDLFVSAERDRERQRERERETDRERQAQ